jgi:hypothetical protein
MTTKKGRKAAPPMNEGVKRTGNKTTHQAKQTLAETTV